MMKKYLILITLILCAYGCGNASMKEMNPNGGVIKLYAAEGKLINTWHTDGKPEMHGGGHIYCREKETGQLIIVYGTYTFEEDKDK